jgi:hypothetical protein
MLRVLSLGAGVQSTTLALMAKHGEFDTMPDCAIFADTGAEPGAVYAHLAWLTSPGVLPFPVHQVTAGNLRDILLDATHARRGHGRPPLYVKNADGSDGIIQRQCTGDFKISPIEKKVRALLGLRFRQRWPREIRVEQWIGISRDEASRAKPAMIRVKRKGKPARLPHPTIRTRWPLIEKLMSRRECLVWLKAHGYPEPPRSACTFCPFHSDAEWRRLRDHDPEGWREAIEVDRAIRRDGFAGLTGTMYLHEQRVPLTEVDLSTAEDRGQINLFENECEGMCGV